MAGAGTQVTWGRRAVDRRPKLERSAAEVQAVFLRMPDEHQAQVAGTIRSMLLAGAGLQVLPDELAAALGYTAWEFFSELHMPFKRKAAADVLIAQIADGAPELLRRLGTSADEILAAVGPEQVRKA